MGQSPMSAPSPNRGYEAAAAEQLGVAIKVLQQVLQTAGATSDVGKTVLEVLSKLVKHSPSGSSSPAVEKQNINRLAMQNAQNASRMQQLRQGGAQQPGAGQAQPGMAA
jgi:hypothetical protein